MATTASYAADCHWDLEPSHSRRCSTETVFSVQDRETDFARDTTDSEALHDDESGIEYEPATDTEVEAPIDDNTSSASDDDIIRTKVVEVQVEDDNDVQFADSERTDSYSSDSEYDFKMEFGRCIRCKIINSNSIYSYCRKCYHIRKSFFPPMPKRKRRGANTKKIESSDAPTVAYPCSQASSSGCSTQMSQDILDSPPTTPEFENTLTDTISTSMRLKRRANSAEEHPRKKVRRITSKQGDNASDLDSSLSNADIEDSDPVQPLGKTVSNSFITKDPEVKLTKKSISNTLLETINSKDLCVVCVSEPKSGVFVHGRIAHICCCYKCAVKVWTKAKRCPVCNCKVSNVLRAVVM